MNSLVSIIIPVYNVAIYLREALDSAINQSYSHLEIIIIEDGSTDASADICDNYAIDPRVIIHHQDNKGLSAARNKGLDMIKGKYIAFLDSDDTYHPDYISSMVAAIEQEKADLIISKYTLHYTTGKLEKAGKVYPSIAEGSYNRISSLHALYNNQINVNVWNKLYKAELWNGIRFSEGHVYEDNETAYRVIDKCNKIYVIDKPLYIHRKRTDSISGTLSWKIINDQLLAASYVEAFIMDRTPEVFSVEQLEKKRLLRLGQMINCYEKSFDIPDNKEYRDDLRQKIIQMSKDVEIHEKRYRGAVALIISNPGVFRIAYSLYNHVRLFLRKTLKR